MAEAPFSAAPVRNLKRRPIPRESAFKEIVMYENETKSTSERMAHTPGHAETATRQEAARRDAQKTDPSFARGSFTMRKMQAWQIAALAIAAVAVIALLLFYF